MLIEIADHWFNLPDDWSDLTLSDFIELNKVAEEVPSEDAVEAEKFSFYIKYISHFGIPEELLKDIRLYDANDQQLGVVNLFNHLWQFTQLPAEPLLIEFKRFNLGKDMYCFNDVSLDITGAKKPMAEYTYQEYEEANGILQAMNKMKEGQLDMLGLLCAIFYRPAKRKMFQWFRSYEIEPYNEESVKARADLFMEGLTMDKVWNAYFFLLKRIARYNVDTANSLLAEVEKNLN